MGFFAVVLALLIEQFRPLAPGNRMHSLFTRFARLVRGRLDGGERRQGVIGWTLVIGGSLVAVLVAEWIARSLHPLFTFVLHVFVLYCTVGFRQFSQAFTEIQVALAADDADGARRVLSGWLRDDEPDEFTASRPAASVPETCRQAIAYALLAAHRHVLGPLFCYIVVPGVAGPVVYRAAEMLARRWRVRGDDVEPLASGSTEAAVTETAVTETAATETAATETASADSPTAPRATTPWGEFAVRAFGIIDWVPVRMSAAGFAVVGNFDDAVYCWRGASAAGMGRDSRSLLMAAGGGALRLRIADPALSRRWAEGERSFEYPGDEPRPESLRSTGGLVWRSLLLWLAVYALITVSAWMGN